MFHIRRYILEKVNIGQIVFLSYIFFYSDALHTRSDIQNL